MSRKLDVNKFHEVVSHLKTKQEQLKHLVSKETIKDAKKYAEGSRRELQKLMKSTDMKKVKAFVEKEARDFQKLQARVPQELAKFSKFVEAQKGEFEKILKSVQHSEAAEFIGKKVGSSVGLKKKSKASSTGAKKTSRKKTPSNQVDQEVNAAPANQENAPEA